MVHPFACIFINNDRNSFGTALLLYALSNATQHPLGRLTRSQADEHGDLTCRETARNILTYHLERIMTRWQRQQKTTTHTAGDVQEQYAHTAQKMAKHLAAAQARDVKYTHRIFESTIALLESHLEDTRSLMEQWGKQGDPKVSDPYMNLFSAPFTAYQQMLEGVEIASKQMFEGVEKASKQSYESLEEANHANIGTARK